MSLSFPFRRLGRILARRGRRDSSGLQNARACIQIHGGMGYTWEVPAHYHYKRAWVLQSLFGDGEEQALRTGDGFDASP